MKKIISIFMCIILLAGLITVNGFCEENENLFINHLESKKGVSMLISSGAVSDDNIFDENGALAAIIDGDRDTAKDIRHKLDWEYPKYVGVLLTLDGEYCLENAVIYSGFDGYTDTYRVYASDNILNLYDNANIAADNVDCNGSAVTVDINKNARYIAFFCTACNGNQRIKELEVYGHKNEEERPDENLRNLLQTSVSTSAGILFDTTNGTMSYNTKFDQNGAIAGATDGNTAAHTDVYGWNQTTKVGVLYTLNDTYFAKNAAIYSGFENLPDYLSVYASDNLDNLFSEGHCYASNVKCIGESVEPEIGAEIKYVAFVFESDGGRIKELELYGKKIEIVSKTVTTDKTNILINGTSVTLQGVNIPFFSFSSYGDGNTAYGNSDADISLNLILSGEWNCKLVRLAVNPEFYLYGDNGTGKGNIHNTAEEYRSLIDSFVKKLTDKGIAVIIDCHAYAGVTQNVVDFWQIAAPHFDGNGLCLYGLLNEPISDWQIFYEGGTVTIPGLGDENSIGIPALLDIVRESSDNVAVIGGINWAFDLSGIASSGFDALATERCQALGKSKQEYYVAYSLDTDSRKGNGIVLDSHIYSNKSLDWDNAVGEAMKEYPIVIGEYNPYYRSGLIDELDDKEKAYYDKIFTWITKNGFSSTSWSLGAEPFLTSSNGQITALGTVVKNFINTGEWEKIADSNLIYKNFKAYRCIKSPKDSIKISTDNSFLSQAYSNGIALGHHDIIKYILDGDCNMHYDIYPVDDRNIGVEFTLDDTFACNKISISSGFEQLPDKYIVFASNDKSNLYSSENIIENASVDIEGTVSFDIDKQVKYVAFLADGYVRIKELSLSGVNIGDANNDLRIDAQDMVLLIEKLLGKPNDGVISSSFDINSDQSVDLLDFVRFKKNLS